MLHAPVMNPKASLVSDNGVTLIYLFTLVLQHLSMLAAFFATPADPTQHAAGQRNGAGKLPYLSYLSAPQQIIYFEFSSSAPCMQVLICHIQSKLLQSVCYCMTVMTS